MTGVLTKRVNMDRHIHRKNVYVNKVAEIRVLFLLIQVKDHQRLPVITRS